MRSKGNEKLIEILKKIFPGYLIKPEHHIGERLRLDAYIQELNAGCEFDGIQHFEFTPFFHETEEDLEEAQKRDKRKEELCKEQGITLIRIKFDEKITKELILDKILKAQGNIEASKPSKKKKSKWRWPSRKLPSRPFNTKRLKK